MSNQYRLYLHPNGYYYHRVKVPADIRRFYGKRIEQSSLQTRDYRDAVRRLSAVIVAVDQVFARFRIEHADELACRNNHLIHVGPSDPSMLNSTHEAPAARLMARKGKFAPTTASPAVSTVAGSSREPRSGAISERSDLPPMSVLSRECFAAIAVEKKWSAKTQVARPMQIKQFIEICGDKPLNCYTQHDIRLLKMTLYALPPQSHVKKEFDSLTKVQIAEKARQLGIPGLSIESVRQIMTAANIVFGWARAEYDITLQNVVQPMIPSPSVGGSKKGRREGFTAPELQKLFNSPVFTGVESADSWLKAGSFRMHNTGRFWIPLLALHSGARLMEAVQLLGQDIGCEDGIWFIDINGDDGGHNGKSVKNETSVRRIPVHSELIRLGFLDFVSTVERGERLFPDVAIGPIQQRHRYASKLFNKLLLSAGVKGQKKVWHSLRHSFEQACRDSRVDSAIMDQLQGHSQRGMRGVYGEHYKLAALNDGIQSIRYEGLDLAHIEPFAVDTL